jgi:hypothetical protein
MSNWFNSLKQLKMNTNIIDILFYGKIMIRLYLPDKFQGLNLQKSTLALTIKSLPTYVCFRKWFPSKFFLCLITKSLIFGATTQIDTTSLLTCN